MAKHEHLYKCRMCDKIFSVNCTDSTKTASNGSLGKILAANGIAPARTSNITATYIMHNCDDGLSGVADFVGAKGK